MGGHRFSAYHGSLGTFGTSWTLQSKSSAASDRGWHEVGGDRSPPSTHREGNGEPGRKDEKGGTRAWRGMGAGPMWGALTGSPGGPVGPMGPVAPGIPCTMGEEQKPV